jgi:hypothetical protein
MVYAMLERRQLQPLTRNGARSMDDERDEIRSEWLRSLKFDKTPRAPAWFVEESRLS